MFHTAAAAFVSGADRSILVAAVTTLTGTIIIAYTLRDRSNRRTAPATVPD